MKKLLTVAFAAIVLFTGCAPAVYTQDGGPGEDWPMEGYDSQHSNSNPAVATPVTPGLLWRRTLGVGGIWASPVVSAGIVYVGSYDGYTYALDAANGRRVWRFRTGPVNSTPAVAAGKVYVGGASSVYALDAYDGELVWEYALEGEQAVSSLLIHDNMLLGAAASFDEATVYAWNAVTGELLWTFGTNNNYVHCLAASGDTVFAQSQEHPRYSVPRSSTLHAIAAQQGSQEWEFKVEETWRINSCPVIYEGTLYVGSNREYRGGEELPAQLYALDVVNGNVRWQFKPSRVGATTNSVLSAAAAEGTVYIATRQSSAPGSESFRVWTTIYAVEADTGGVLWESLIDPGLGETSSPPTVAGETVYVGTDYGWIVALNAGSGQQLWEFEVARGTHIEGSPAVVNGALYAVSTNVVFAVGGAGGARDAPAWPCASIVLPVLMIAGSWTRRRRYRLAAC